MSYVSLYLSPNNMVRSRSTLMTVSVDDDTEHNSQPDTPVA